MAAELLNHLNEANASGVDLIEVVALLAAGVIAVPIFRRLGLGSVLGYLAAGLVVGPYGLKLVADPEAILHAAELGVVMFLFIIGLEMEPSRLWSLRKQIFGLGVAQVVVCGALLTLVGVVLGLSVPVAFVAGMGFVLTSTAVVMQLLEEEGDLTSPSGQKIVSILLLEDLAIVPLLAILALLAPGGGSETLASRALAVGGALVAVVVVVFLGRYVLNPVFRVLANARAREVMTAAALLVILGAALIMEWGGLSMAMGAFLAGVLLSTSTFKHQLEADVEPFRGLLLGLFFLAIGMSLDVSVVIADWQILIVTVVAYVALKALAIYGLARLLGSDQREAVQRAVLMAQGGEFAFVLYTTAVATGLIDAGSNALFTATVIISMALTPLTALLMQRLLPDRKQSFEGVEEAFNLRGTVLIIGFGRFGQIAAQVLLTRGHSVSIIDTDTEMIRVAGRFGAKVYYGDGTRLDILHAAGADTATVVMIAIDDKAATTKIAELLRDEFPLVKVMARAFDRGHAIELVKIGVEFQIRELFESALVFGAETIKVLGATDEETAEIVERVRARDEQRFNAQVLGGIRAGGLLISNADEQARESGHASPKLAPIDVDAGEPATAPASAAADRRGFPTAQD